VTVTDLSSGKVVAAALTDADGGFRFSLPPGDYSLGGVGNPHLVHVSPGQQLQEDLRFPNP
jgi:hypothetical protein